MPALRASRPSGFASRHVLGFASRTEVPLACSLSPYGLAIRDKRGFTAAGGSDFDIDDAIDPDPDAEEETTFDIDILN